MMRKKAQTDVIVTVLLVLIALAAVALIATFVIKNVRTNTANADDAASCALISLQIASATNGSTTVSIMRNAGGESVDVGALNVLVNGASKNSTAVVPAVASTSSVYIGTTALAKGDKVEVSITLKDGTSCGVKDTTTVL